MPLKKWILQNPLLNRRKAIRRDIGGYAAGYWAGSDLRQDAIRDISATGVYLLTRERWQPGTPVVLILHRTGLQTTDYATESINMPARAVRCCKDGIGFAFDIPSEVDPRLWINLVERARHESTSDDVVAPFKTAKALAFLSRVCGP